MTLARRAARTHAKLVLSAILATLLLACSPTPQPSQAGGLDSDGPVECAIAQQPGPDDAPPANAEMDTRDLGPGRWHLCLAAPTVVSAEGRAWCRWDPARNQVEDVAGLPLAMGAVEYDAIIDRDGDFEIHVTNHEQGGAIANYRVAPGNIVIPGPVTRQNGLLQFEATLFLADPDSAPPPGAPPTVGGMLRWVCGGPPPA